MKKISTIAGLLFLLIALNVSTSHSRIINITVANFSFTPSTINNAIVGDTIKWTWTSGSHTTTCDGRALTSRPTGAAPWNVDINSGSPTFTYVLQVAGTYNYICVPHAPDMAGVLIVSMSSIKQLNEIVTGYNLTQNYPNPFNPSTKIKFSVPKLSNVSLKVFDSNGREIENLVNNRLNPSSYEVDWNASGLSSGVYYYRIEIRSAEENFAETKKMLLIK